jgi:transcriptional antiterminator NusG
MEEQKEQPEVKEIQEAPEDTAEVKEESATVESEASGGQIYVIKVTTNKEDRALEMISDKVNKKQLSVFTLTRPHGLRGYIFLEAIDRDTAEEAAYNLPYVKGIIGKTISYEEIKNMLTPNIEEININEGDIVEIIGEPFKKEKAKVTRVDKQKGEVVVSLLGAVVPIPVTVKIDNVKVIRREDEEGEDEETENKQQDQEFAEGPKIGGL